MFTLFLTTFLLFQHILSGFFGAEKFHGVKMAPEVDWFPEKSSFKNFKFSGDKELTFQITRNSNFLYYFSSCFFFNGFEYLLKF